MELNDLLLQNDSLIRRQYMKDSISPDTIATQLDRTAQFATELMEQAKTSIANANHDTMPESGINVYNANDAGTYVNFLDSGSAAVVVTSEDLDEGLVQLRKVGFSWQKVIVPVGDLAIYAKKTYPFIGIGDKSRFVNIFNKENVRNGYVMNGSTGAITVSPGLQFCGYQTIPNIKRLRFQGVSSSGYPNGLFIWFYDANFNAVTHINIFDSDLTLTVPDDAVFLAFNTKSNISVFDPNTIQIEEVYEGQSAASDLEPYLTTDIKPQSLTVKDLVLYQDTFYQTNFYDYTSTNPVVANVRELNVFNKREAIAGYLIDATNGNVSLQAPSNYGRAFSGFQKVNYRKKYYISGLQSGVNVLMNFYDSDKTRIGTQTISSGQDYLIIPAGSRYIAFSAKVSPSGLNTDLNAVQIEEIGSVDGNYPSPYVPFGTLGEGRITDSKPTGEFDEYAGRIIVGNDLYLVDENNLQLFSHSMCGDENYEGNFSIQSNNADLPISRYFTRDLVLDSSMFINGHSVRISNKPKNTMSLYYKNVNVHKVAKSNLVGKTADVIIIGDSITDGITSSQAVTPYVAGLLQSWGANISYFGTMADSGYKNEGRSGWEYSILIGRKTQYNEGVYAPTDSTTAPLLSNPFIKIATSQQILDHPEWVFECTPTVTPGAGVTRELNYTESQAVGTYIGNYYTLDFGRYVQNNLSNSLNPANRLIVVCALGFNDLNRNAESPQSIADSLQSMQIIHDRVKAYRSDAIVAFVPIVIINEDNNYDKYCSWVEQAMILAVSLGADIIPVWQHVDRYLAYNYSNTVALPSPATIVKGTSSDTVHPMVFGTKQYANTVSNFVANKI